MIFWAAFLDVLIWVGKFKVVLANFSALGQLPITYSTLSNFVSWGATGLIYQSPIKIFLRQAPLII